MTNFCILFRLNQAMEKQHVLQLFATSLSPIRKASGQSTFTCEIRYRLHMSFG